MLLDSAGGSPQLARRHYLAWDPVFRLRARRGVVSVTAGGGVRREDGPQARALADQAAALIALAPFEALRQATRIAALERPVPDLPEAEALVGLLSYDAVRYLERLPDTVRDDLGIPDIDVFLPGRLLRYDLVERRGRARRPPRRGRGRGGGRGGARGRSPRARAPPLPRRAARQRPAGVPQHLHAGGVRGGRAPDPRVRLRRRHLPGQPQPAARPLLRAAEPAPLRHAAHGEPQPVRRLPPLRRVRADQLVAGAPRLARRRGLGRDPPHRRHAAPRLAHRRRTSPTSSTSTPRTAPSTSCWSTSSATTSAGSASTAPCA